MLRKRSFQNDFFIVKADPFVELVKVADHYAVQFHRKLGELYDKPTLTKADNALIAHYEHMHAIMSTFAYKLEGCTHVTDDDKETVYNSLHDLMKFRYDVPPSLKKEDCN